MTIALLHKHYDKKHLENIKNEMLEMGTPEIKMIFNESQGVWMAIEGSHRLRAAKELNITPEIIDVTNEKNSRISMRGRRYNGKC